MRQFRTTQTPYKELNNIVWRRRSERQLETIASGHEGLVNATHDVDLCPFTDLLFVPDHWIVEHIVA